MAKSLDGLIHHLVDQIALFGERGALPSDFASQVRDYYAHSDSTNVDRPFLEQVWKWLIRNPEILLGDHAAHNRLSLSEVEAQNAAIKEARVSDTPLQHQAVDKNIAFGEASKSASDTQVAKSLHSSDALATLEPIETNDAPDLPGQYTLTGSAVGQHDLRPPAAEPPGTGSTIRLYTSENRMWHALAGHGPDPNKIKALDFACLSMIAARGSKGIYQHELVKLSGQDKRSLPARTDRLHNDGYIEKTRAAFQQLQPRKIVNTSHLILKRFAKSEPSAQSQNSPKHLSVDEYTESISNEDEDLNKQVGRPQWTPYRSLSSQIFELVAHSGTQGMTMKAIRERLFCDYVRKPMDEYVMRLVECWQLSQPLHLRHLSIIRDTTLKAKTTVYTYFTFDNFQKLVDQGKRFWDAVKTVPDGATNGINVAASLDAQPELDDYGFPVLDSSLFEGHNNDATLEGCASALKADRFRISRHDPMLMKQFDGTYAVKYQASGKACSPQNSSRRSKEPKTSRRKLTSINPRFAESQTALTRSPPSTAEEPALELSAPKPRRHTTLIVKQKGRPRIYPKAGAPPDIGTKDPHFMKRLHGSREMAEKYARSKIENEITWRIEEGQDAVSVTNDVLASVETLRKEDGQEPLSKYSREIILHTFAGGPMPENVNSNARGRRKQIPYWPSMAAHTLLVPGQLRNSSTSSRHSPQTVIESVAPSGRKRRVPARFEGSEDKIEAFPASKKRRKTANTIQDTEILYLPSLAAHSCPPVFAKFLDVNAPEAKVQSKARQRHGFYLPSVAAHTGVFSPALSKPKRVPLKRKAAIEIPAQPQEGAAPFIRAPMRSESCYLPSIAAHSTPNHSPEIQPPPNSISSRNLEETCPNWIKSLLKYYEREAKGISRLSSGVFLGETKPRKKRKEEPAGPRPPFFKIAIFKSARLKDLNWLRATLAAPRQVQPQTQTQGFESGPIQSALPASLTSGLVTMPARGSRPGTAEDEPKGLASSAWQLPPIRPSNSNLMSPDGSPIPSKNDPNSLRTGLEDRIQDPSPQEISERNPCSGQGFPAQMIPFPVTEARRSSSAEGTDISLQTPDPPRESSTFISENQLPPNLGAAPHATDQDSSKTEEDLRVIGQRSSSLEKSASVEDVSEHSRHNRSPAAPLEGLPSSTGEMQTRYIGEAPIQTSPLPKTSESYRDIDEETPVSTPAAPTVDASRDPKHDIPQPIETHSRVLTQASMPLEPRQTKSKVKAGQKSFPMMSRRGGSVAALRRKIVMDIMEKCEGVFAGSREMTKLFATEWTKRGQEGTPEEKTVQNTVSSLCDEGSLRQITFAFRNKQGKLIKKAMLTFPDVSDADPRVKEFQMNVMAYYPSHYLPRALLASQKELGTESQCFDFRVDRPDIGDKIRVGKAKAAEATLATMRLQERARSELVGQQVTGTEDHRDDMNASRSTDPTSDAVRKVPSVPHLPPSNSKRLAAVKSPRGGGMERTRGARKVSNAGSARPLLPPSAGGLSGTSNTLVWLPEKFAFIDYNYEEDRPTVVEPAIRRDVRPRHSRYGSQMSALKPLRHIDRKDRIGPGTKPQSQEKHDKMSNHYSRASISNSDLTPENSIPTASSSHQSPPNVSSPIGNRANVSTPEDQLAYSMYVSPYATVPRFVNLAPADNVQITRTPSQALAVAVPANALPPALPSEELQPRQKRLLVSFMDGTHYFHQNTGTFSVSFSGLRPSRQINNWVGTCLKPYSLGPRKSHHEFPAPRGPRNLNLLPKRPLDAEDTQFEQQVDACLNWELETLGLQDAEFKDLTFVNHTFHHVHATAEAVEPKMDTIAEVLMSSKKGRLFSRKIPNISEVRHKIGKSKLISRNRNVSAAAAEALKRIERRAPLKRRRLTSLAQPQHVDDASKTISRDEDDRPRKFRRIRGPRDANFLSPEGEIRLLTAVMVVRILTGGLEQIVDWVLVAKAFEPDMSQTFVRTRWNYVLQKHKSMLPKMESDFQDLFLEAYEGGTMPAVDYENLASFDWKWLTEWTMDKFKTASKSQPELPGRRLEFDDSYEVQDYSKIDINDYYGINGPGQTVASREKLINSNAYVCPVISEHQGRQSLEHGNLSIAKTWIRANVITPEETYDPSLARVKLETIPNQVIDKALKSLLLDKVLSQENRGRLVPGRNYDISEQFVSRLKKNILPEHFQQATAFKRKLDEEIHNKNSVPCSPASSDGEILAITNLQAHHRIRVVPINVPANKWGQTDGSYESRHMDKSRLNFQLEIEPKQAYVHGNPLFPLPEPPNQHLDEPMAKIPLWFDIHGAFVPLMWNMLLAAVMAVLAVRPGVGAEEIAKNLKPGVEAWEVDLVLTWLADAGAASRVGSGYLTREWWWLVFDEGAEGKGKEKEVVNDDEREHINNGDEIMDLADDG